MRQGSQWSVAATSKSLVSRSAQWVAIRLLERGGRPIGGLKSDYTTRTSFPVDRWGWRSSPQPTNVTVERVTFDRSGYGASTSSPIPDPRRQQCKVCRQRGRVVERRTRLLLRRQRRRRLRRPRRDRQRQHRHRYPLTSYVTVAVAKVSPSPTTHRLSLRRVPSSNSPASTA